MPATPSVAITMPSRNRPAQALRASKMFGDRLIVSVEEREMDTYRKAGLNPVARPDNPGSLGAIRNWILDNTDAEMIWQVDDDVNNFSSLCGRIARRSTSPSVIVPILDHVAIAAHGIETAMFGLGGSAKPMHYQAMEPFKLTSVPHTFGVRKDIGIRFDERLSLRDDYDFALATMAKCRIVWIDSRFTFFKPIFAGAGGNSKFRSVDHLAREREILVSKWGGAVVQDKAGTKGRWGNLLRNVPRRQKIDPLSPY